MKSLIHILLASGLALAGCNNYDIQPEQAGGFIKFYTSTLSEEGVDVRQTPDGGYVAAGNTIAEDGTSDIYLVSTDPYGNEITWSPKTFGTAGVDDAATALEVVDDGYIVLGSYRMHPDSSLDMYIMKISPNGEKVWESRAGGMNDDYGTDLVVTADGDIIAAGLNKSVAAGDQYAWLVVFDASGNKIGESFGGFVGENILSTSLVEGENFYLMCGVLESENDRLVLYPINKADPNLVLYDKPSSVQNLETGGMDALENGDFLVCGTINPASGFDEAYLARLRPASTNWQTTFSVVWEKNFGAGGGNADLLGSKVRIIDQNTFAVIGTRIETGNDDMLLLLVDGDGNEIDRSMYGDEGFQIGEGIDLTSGDNGLILIGTNGSEDNSMISLLKTDASGKL